jgi:pSer/pThr/pTyr-binding forkhead associated (FHA) protein
MNYDLGQAPTPGLGRMTPERTFLRLCNGPKTGLEIPLHHLTMVLGRNNLPHGIVDIDLSDCELGTPPMISRNHAIFQWVEGVLQICDLNSRNGSWVNDRQLIPHSTEVATFVTLSLGDIIKFGNLEFEVITHD